LRQILRAGIKKESLPFETLEKLERLMNNEKPQPPLCGCIEVNKKNLFFVIDTLDKKLQFSYFQ